MNLSSRSTLDQVWSMKERISKRSEISSRIYREVFFSLFRFFDSLHNFVKRFYGQFDARKAQNLSTLTIARR